MAPGADAGIGQGPDAGIVQGLEAGPDQGLDVGPEEGMEAGAEVGTSGGAFSPASSSLGLKRQTLSPSSRPPRICTKSSLLWPGRT